MNKEPRLRFTDEERSDPALEKPIRKAEKAAARADKAQANNRIALYVAQKGKCAVSGVELEAKQVDCHHKSHWCLGAMTATKT